jgi:hypothetical protein
LSDFFSLSFGFFFVALLFEPMSKDVEEFKLDCGSDLKSAQLSSQDGITHKYDCCQNTKLDNHGLSQGVLSTIQLGEQIPVS